MTLLLIMVVALSTKMNQHRPRSNSLWILGIIDKWSINWYEKLNHHSPYKSAALICTCLCDINIFSIFSLLIVSFFLYLSFSDGWLAPWLYALYTYMTTTTHTHTALLFRRLFLLKRSIKIKIVSYNKTPINNTNNAAVNSSMTWCCEWYKASNHALACFGPIAKLTT